MITRDDNTKKTEDHKNDGICDAIVDTEKKDEQSGLTDDEKIDEVAKKVLEQYLPAFRELAK